MKSDTIVAVATAKGYAGIGVVRISGDLALNILCKMTNKSNYTPNIATYTKFYSQDHQILDSGIAIYFKSPHSFTGEDIVELQGHGSPIVLQMIVKRAIELGCRLARAGEFSERAFINGKIDLVQAESIIDLIHAESESAAKSALKSLNGTFSQRINTINKQLIDLRMFVEATLDFPEEDIEFIVDARIRDKLVLLQNSINSLLKNTRQGVILNNGANVVIVGQPNVGKSSLLNRLADEEIAIVTDIAGTTRDIVKEKIIINDIVLNIIDTAGIRETADTIEQIGIKRTFMALDSADLCLILIDATRGLDNIDTNILNQINQSIPKIFVYNKIDLIPCKSIQHNNKLINGSHHIYISAKHNIGIQELRQIILESIGFENNNQDVFIARTRHLNALTKAVEHIDMAFHNWSNLEIIAEELRYGHNKLAEITGEFSSDDLLGEIFSRFCIGK